jgi:hypothetical protein
MFWSRRSVMNVSGPGLRLLITIFSRPVTTDVAGSTLASMS